MRTYETVIVIDSLLKSEEIDAIVEKVERIIKNNGGEIVEIDRWGKKRLAYEIKKRQYGYYVDIIFQGPGNLVYILEREYGLDENILRYLTVHLNKRALQHKERQKMEQTKKESSSNETIDDGAADESHEEVSDESQSKEDSESVKVEAEATLDDEESK